MHATDTTDRDGTETRGEQDDSDTAIWQQYVDQHSVSLADGLTVGEVAERFPVESFDDVDTLCRRALIEVPAERSCYELADFEAAAEAVRESAASATGESTAQSVESDGGYQIVTGDGDDPLDDEDGIELSQDEQVATVQNEIDRMQETTGGESR